MSDDTKAAPSLADKIAQTLKAWPKDGMILRAGELREVLAAFAE